MAPKAETVQPPEPADRTTFKVWTVTELMDPELSLGTVRDVQIPDTKDLESVTETVVQNAETVQPTEPADPTEWKWKTWKLLVIRNFDRFFLKLSCWS